MTNKDAGVLIKPKVFPQNLWESHTLDELAAMQNVKPITDVKSLLGGWPSDVDDGFEEAVIALRNQN